MPTPNAKARQPSVLPKVKAPTSKIIRARDIDGVEPALSKMIKAGNIDGVRRRLPSKTAPRHRERAVSLAVSCANEDILRLLLENRAPGDNYDEALLDAVAANAPIEMFRLLLPIANPKARDSIAIIRAAAHGHVEILRELIPVSDVQVNDAVPLRHAAENGDLDSLAILLPVTNNLKAIIKKYGKTFDPAALDLIQSKLDEDALRGKSKLKITPVEPTAPRQRRPM